MKVEQRLEGVAIRGKPYEARMELKIPVYTKHQSAVDAVFARFKQWAELNVMEVTKGEFTLAFQPLERGKKDLDHVKFAEALKKVTPFNFVFEKADGY